MKWNVGEEVVVHPAVTCCECEFCLRGRENLCVNTKIIGAHIPGGYAEYVAVPARIQVFTADGTYQTQWGSGGSGAGQFDFPSDVAVDASGKVYVADYGNGRIQVFTANGTFLTQWGSYGSGEGQFSYPSGIVVDAAQSGKVYVADWGNNRIQVVFFQCGI